MADPKAGKPKRIDGFNLLLGVVVGTALMWVALMVLAYFFFPGQQNH